ncbi:hypothetical protein HZB03_04590, partial [Candidatus Woesearchaeota archaeon]|nr:hypothetical protein [Candidatus Woesearchaeota archaeon]
NYTNDTVTDGNYFYKVTAVDLGGLESSASNEVNVTVDTRGPVGSLSLTPSVVRDGARFLMKYVGAETSLNVSVNTSSVDSGGVVIQLNDTDQNAVYEANYTISETNTRDDGNYTLTAIIRDSARNTLNTSAVITLDNSLPTGSMTIIGVNGSKITGSTSVVLNLSFNDTNALAGCRFTNDNVSLLNFSTLEPCLSTKPWILSANEGNKTVFAEFLDVAGNSLIVNDSIEYRFIQDYTAPTKPIIYDGLAGDDIDWWNDNTSLSAHWFNSTEDMSEIYYKYRIRINATIINGTLTNSSGCVPADCNFTDVGRDTTVTRTNLSLIEGTNYSFEIETFNPYNISAGSAYSDGVTIDVTAPGLPTINSSTHPINISTANNTPAFNWSATDVLSGAVRSGVTGYSWILDTHPGTAPDDVLEARFEEPLASSANNGFGQTLKANSTGQAFSVFTELETNVTRGDTLKVRLALAESSADARDTMVIDVYAIRKGETDGASAFVYNETANAISNVVRLQKDIAYAENFEDAAIYSADLVINQSFNGSSDAIYIVVAGLTFDDDNKNNISIAATNDVSKIDNSTRNFFCPESGSCIENTSTRDYAIEVKRVENGTMFKTQYQDLADGTYYFHVKAKDLAGNFGDTSHYKIIIDRVFGIDISVTDPDAGTVFTIPNISVSVLVSDSANVFAAIRHSDGSNSTSSTVSVNTTYTFTNLVLKNGTNEIFAVGSDSNNVTATSQSVFVIFGESSVPITNKTLLVTYNVGGSSTTHMAYATSASDTIGLASENDAATVSGAGSLSVRSDTSTIPTKIFVTNPSFNPTAIEQDLDDNDFLDRLNPMFGFTRKNDEFVIRSELRYRNIYLSGERRINP